MEIQSSSSNRHREPGSRYQGDREGKDSIPGKPCIVIVDDEFFVTWHLQSLLEDMGFTNCEVANDSGTAISLAVERDVSLLLMDVNLGGGPDGVETVRRILERRNIEVIFITAYTDEENLRRIRDVKPDAPILAKPVSFELLQAAIKRLFPTD